MLSTTHIVNRLSMYNLACKSRFEVLHGKAPEYTTLRTIGYLCFAANVGKKDKFAIRASMHFLRIHFWFQRL